MITAYYRPETIEEALAYLARRELKTVPLGGGTVLNQPAREDLAVVDLQALKLNGIELHGNLLSLGATATLQALLEWRGLAEILASVIRYEATPNLRNQATLAGTIVSADGRSPLTTALLALDAQVEILGQSSGAENIDLGDLLPLRMEILPGKLITRLNLSTNARLAFEYVARTPADLPIVCVAAAQWPSGRTRLALGGFGGAPLLAMDGPESGGFEDAVSNAYSDAGDEWASAAYRQDVAVSLAKRCVQSWVDA